MNAVISNRVIEDYSGPSRPPGRRLEPLPSLDDPDGDFNLIRILVPMDSRRHHSFIPERRDRLPEMPTTAVSASIIRRIENELATHELDSRTVFNHCRGLARGSLEFEEAYIAARIRTFANHQKGITGRLAIAAARDFDTQQPDPYQIEMKPKAAPPRHPMAVYHLGDLMSHLGIWVFALIATQAWAAWRLTALTDKYFEGGRHFHLALMMLVIFAVDSFVWFRRRGRLSDAFLAPGAVLFLLALAPILTLHVRDILLAMR